MHVLYVWKKWTLGELSLLLMGGKERDLEVRILLHKEIFSEAREILEVLVSKTYTFCEVFLEVSYCTRALKDAFMLTLSDTALLVKDCFALVPHHERFRQSIEFRLAPMDIHFDLNVWMRWAVGHLNFTPEDQADWSNDQLSPLNFKRVRRVEAFLNVIMMKTSFEYEEYHVWTDSANIWESLQNLKSTMSKSIR